MKGLSKQANYDEAVKNLQKHLEIAKTSDE